VESPVTQQTNSLKSDLTAIVDRFNGQKLMVIGDLIADIYLEGKISRISREAPVLILEYAGETVVPGGAANVMNNVAALGGQVIAVGVIGADSPGTQILKLLQEQQINTTGLYREVNRPTVTKTRVIAGGIAAVTQQVVRIDRAAKAPLAPAAEARLMAAIETQIPQVKAVILSDYGYQCITPTIREQTIARCRAANIPCSVDSRYAIRAFKGVNIAKQNELELAAAVGYPLNDEATLLRAGRELLGFLEAETLMITRGPEGITLFGREDPVVQIPVTNASEVFDVSGAGDTVVAVMMLAIAAGASRVDAARLANYAAGIVVRKLGTATTNPVELKQALGGDA
jgi:rfaE bifunctional protein kinase chain/domain